jgi:8-oxo-dGTP pyrophosphatase MutT (NUDIX family)
MVKYTVPVLQNFPAKICHTVAGFLVDGDKVLLVKHKKLGLWLAPGGHIEKDELLHKAAEREFWEEAGIKVVAVSARRLRKTTDSEELPMPFASNLHWVSEENFRNRTADPEKYKTEAKWSKGCEQHLCWMYFMKATGDLHFKQNTEESDGIGWFGIEDLPTLTTTEDIKNEIRMALKLQKARK